MILMPRNITHTEDKKDNKENISFYNTRTMNSNHFQEYFNTAFDNVFSNGNASSRKNKKKKSTREVKKRQTEFIPLIVPTRLFGEKVEIEVAKKAGRYTLAGGCVLDLEEGIFAKKTAIVSCVVPPNKRSDFVISCEYQSFLVSEMFILCSKGVPKKPLTFYIPSVIEPNKFSQLMSCTKIDFKWNPINDFQLERDGVIFATDTWGIFAIIQKAPTETIKVTNQGGLINTVVHPFVSLRIPKTSCPTEAECTMQFFQSNREVIEEITPCYPHELTNIVNASAMLCITFPDIELKRAVTVKMPLPPWALDISEGGDETKKTTDFLLLCKRHGSWDTIESKINFTKNTFSFNTTVFGTFVLLEPRANREGKVKSSMPRFEYVNNVVKGAFLVFLWFETKSWYIWVELTTSDKIGQLKSKRESGGLIFVEQYIPSSTNNVGNLNKKMSRQSSAIPRQNAECRRTLELSEGSIFHLQLEGNVKFKENSVNSPIVSKQFQKMFHSIIKRPPRASIISNSRLSARRLSTVSSQGSEDDFLSKVGVKKDVVVKAADSNNAILPTSMIYYTKLEENYRIIEIEPKDEGNLADDIVEKWKQKVIINEDRQTVPVKEEIRPEPATLEASEILPNFKSEELSEDVRSEDSFEEEGLIFRAQTKESKARTQLMHDDEEEFTFSAILKISHDKLSAQIPPNHFETDITEERKKELIDAHINNDMGRIDFQYKFYVEPDEMREYLGINKPSLNAVNVTRDKNAEKLLNPYLKEVNRGEVDAKLLQKTKLTAMSNIASKTNQVLFNEPSEASKAGAKQTKSKGGKVGHKVDDKVSIDNLYKEPKVLSGKSLQVLSRYIEQGLTLAVHLNIPDSVITSIGFDSLSANLSLSEVSYKVITHWKRSTIHSSRSQMPALLIQSFNNMNLTQLADIVKAALEKNEELTKEHFKFMIALPHNSVEEVDDEDSNEVDPNEIDAAGTNAQSDIQTDIQENEVTPD